MTRKPSYIFNILLSTSIVVSSLFSHISYGQEGCMDFINDMNGHTLPENIKEFNYFEGTPECAKKIADILSQTAKRDKDSLNLSKVYAVMSYRAEAEHSLLYADSLVTLNKDPGDFYYYDVNIIKGYIHYFMEQPLEAVEEFNKAHELGLSEDNFELEILSLIWIAQIKGEQTKSKESLKIYHEALNSINNKKWKPEDDITKNELKIEVLESILLYYINNRVKDSTEYFLNEFKKVHNEYPSESFKYKIPIWEGKLAFFKKDYDNAYSILEKNKPHVSGLSLLDVTYTLGKIREVQGSEKAKIEEFIKFDSISSVDSLPPTVEYKDVYMSLINSAIEKKDKSKQLDYLNKLIYADSFLLNNRIEAHTIDIPGYSVEHLRKERDDLMNQSNLKDNLMLILGLIVMAILGVLANYFYKYRKAKKTLSDFLDNIGQSKITTRETRSTTDSAQEPAIEIALHKLNAWEYSKGYLDKNVDMGSLANILKTNRTYVSKAINIHKGKNFRNYITDLRMDHFISATKNNYDYKNKNIRKIIEEFGFNSMDTFNRALKAKLNNDNITPSMYMDEIIKRNT